MKIFLYFVLCFFVSGCTLGEINSIHRKANFTEGESHIIDAKQRFVVTYKRPKESGQVSDKTGVSNNSASFDYVTCAEPSPDVFSVYAASGEASVSKGGASGAGSFSSTETGAQLGERSIGLQALRDAYFRLCEAYAVGAIDKIDYMIGQRHNQTALMGLLAIEEMNAIARAPSVVIGGQAGAVSASGIQRMTSMLATLSNENADLKNESDAWKSEIEDNKKKKQDATQGTDEQKAQKKAANVKIDKDNEALQKKIDKNTNKIKSNNKAIAALEKGLENAGATGTYASSVAPVFIGGDECDSECVDKSGEVAKQMVKVVQTLNDDDYGPTICLSYFRSQKDLDEDDQSKITQVCGDVLGAYSQSIRERGKARIELLKQLVPGVLATKDKELLSILVQAAAGLGGGAVVKAENADGQGVVRN